MRKEFLYLGAVAFGNFLFLLLTVNLQAKANESVGEGFSKHSFAGTVRSRRDIAIVTMLGETSRPGHNSYSSYEKLASLSLQSIVTYATKWGYPFYYSHDFLMDKSKQAYWSKIAIMKHYLGLGFKFVLYVDVDVLFIDQSYPLERLIVPNAHIIGVDECVRRNVTSSLVRSGFIFLRNSPETKMFLLDWGETFQAYHSYENPEQSSLEKLVTVPEHKRNVYLHSWKEVHAYDTCEGSERSFSLHFPGLHKVRRAARWYLMANILQEKGHHVIDFDFAKIFGHVNGTRSLARRFLSESEHRAPIKVPDASIERVKKCLRKTREEGYFTAEYAPRKHSFHVRYNDVFLFEPIPKIVHVTLPNKRNIPEKVKGRLATWERANFTLMLHDDEDMKDLVGDFAPQLAPIWDSLQAVIRSDIWRYLAVKVYGGWYADSDVELVKPLDEWGHDKMRTLVVGVEAQNVKTSVRHEGSRPVFLSQYFFGASADHPVLEWILEKVVAAAPALVDMSSSTTSVERRLAFILNTTGPAAWTDAIAESMCYSDTFPDDMASSVVTPSSLYAGGRLVNTHVFDVGAFGSGQTHSGSPKKEENRAYIWHHFGGSKIFWGKSWPSLSGPELKTPKTKCSVVMAGWHDEFVSPINKVAEFLQKDGCKVSAVGLSVDRPFDELRRKISEGSVVVWWKTYAPPSDGKLEELRKSLPQQKWVLFNWDEPQDSLIFKTSVSRIKFWDAAFVSGTAVRSLYLERGVKNVEFFPFPVDTSIFHEDFDANIEANCGIYMNLESWGVLIATNPPFVEGEKLAKALCQDRSIRLVVDGPASLERELGSCYGRAPDSTRSRRMFSSCKLVVHVQKHDGFGEAFMEKTTNELLHCRSNILLDGSTGAKKLGLEGVLSYMRSDKMDDIVAQAKEFMTKKKKEAFTSFRSEDLARKFLQIANN